MTFDNSPIDTAPAPDSEEVDLEDAVPGDEVDPEPDEEDQP